MRFLIFSAQYLPTTGGVERFTAELGRTLRGMGHEVSVVTSALPGLPSRETDATGMDVFRLPAFLLMNGRFPVVRFGAPFRRLAVTLWRKPYDFALIHTRFYPLSLWAAKMCKRQGIPAMVLEHGTKHLSMDNALLNAIGNGYEHAMMRLVRRHCDTIYGISQASVQWLEHFGVKAKGVLYNAVDAAAIEKIAAAPPYNFRQRYALPANTPLIVFVGRFILEKGVQELLEAFALLRQQLPSAHLIMAGEGPLLAGVQKQALPGVILAGNLPHPETLALMAQSDIFCLPTYSEGFSSTILEAAAAGCCIVTTPTGGSPELLQDQKSGILLKSIQPTALAGVLYDALLDNAFRLRAGALAQLAVASRFTWSATASRLVALAAESKTTCNDGKPL